MTSYVILVDRTPDGGYGAWAPDLPGCVALGDSFEECVAEMGQAVRTLSMRSLKITRIADVSHPALRSLVAAAAQDRVATSGASEADA